MIAWLLAFAVWAAEPDPRVWVSADVRPDGQAILTVEVAYAANGTIRTESPVAEGLEFTESAPPVTEDLGDTKWIRVVYDVAGSPGSYEVGPIRAIWSSDAGHTQTADSRSLFVDLGVAPPRSAEIADIADPISATSAPRWWPRVALALATFAVAAVLAWRRRQTPSTEPATVQTPGERALGAWRLLREDATKTPVERAEGLSSIVRTFLEDILRFEATAQTTSEVFAALEQTVRISDTDRRHSRSLLSATDRLKFADARATESLFDEFDTTLRTLVRRLDRGENPP